ncbi:MAG: SIMPL domain-containing protein [Erythrobacter sp.]
MRKPVMMLAAGALAAGTLPAPALAGAVNIEIEASGPVVELSVHESISAAPDMVTIGAGVSTEAPTAVEALRMNSAEMAKVIAEIRKSGVAARDIQTAGINLNARYDYDNAGRRQIFRGYQASNRVSVILRDIAATGRVLDALVAAGATDLSGPNFGLEDDAAAKDEARKRAFARAEAQAGSYAAMLGYRGARVLSISESMSGHSPMPERAMMKTSADVAAAPPVEPGMVSTAVSITVQYELVNDDGTQGNRPDGNGSGIR